MEDAIHWMYAWRVECCVLSRLIAQWLVCESWSWKGGGVAVCVGWVGVNQ